MKRIASLVLIFVLSAVGVSAASMHGEFEGYPIVKVTNGGQAITTEGVPAINFNGRTMVPIYMLRELGLKVGWDQSSYSVDVSGGFQTPTTNQKVKDTEAEIIKLNQLFENNPRISDIRLSYDSVGSYMSADIYKSDNALSDMFLVALLSLGTDAKKSYLNYYYDSQIKLARFILDREDIQNWSDKKITGSEFYDLWIKEWEESSTPQPNITIPSTSLTTPDVIESKIDGDFEGWDGETIFKLANGQIWQQSSYAYKYSYKYRPDVLIYKNSYGIYKMKVDGVDGEVSVIRLK